MSVTEAPPIESVEAIPEVGADDTVNHAVCTKCRGDRPFELGEVFVGICGMEQVVDFVQRPVCSVCESFWGHHCPVCGRLFAR